MPQLDPRGTAVWYIGATGGQETLAQHRHHRRPREGSEGTIGVSEG